MSDDGVIRLLVRNIEFPDASNYSFTEKFRVELKPEFVAVITKRAVVANESIIFLHSHPGSESPEFSLTDSEGERRLREFLAFRHPTVEHVSVIISRGGILARRLGYRKDIRVVKVGQIRQVLADPSRPSSAVLEIFDRQIRAFGQAGQDALGKLRIGFAGLGGIGSLTAQMLVHLGVRNFILIDPDVLETTNLNRVASCTPDDIGKPKIDLAARYIASIAPDAKINLVQDNVMRATVARRLANTDFIFCCTDSHGSRAVIQQVCYQFLIPCIDIGVTITASHGLVTSIWGRVQLLGPGFPCLTCQNLLNANEIRSDMMTPYERKMDPYIQGERVPVPAVMSLNGTVSSLAVTMLLAVVAGVPSDARHLLYDGISSILRKVASVPDPNCPVCSMNGSLARGDSWPLLARQD